MDGNSQLSFNAKIEIDQAQSIKNVQRAVDDIGKKTTMEVGGLKFNFDDMAKEFNKFVSQSFKMGKNNELTSMTTQLMNQYGQIMTVQHKVLEDGTMQVEQTKITTEALKVQKERYEEIRELYEKVGKLQAESLSVSKKKQESIANEVKETQKLIREKEKALKAEGLTSNNLQNSTIEKQKLENAKLLTKEEEKLDKKRTSAYAKLQKSLELIHKYNMQSVNANEQDLAVLEKKKAVATSMRNSAQGTINRSGLSDDKLNEQIAQLKEIQALELEAAQQKAEQKILNNELIALDSRRLATKKQLETIGNDDNARAVLEKQLEEQALAVFQKRAQLEQKGLMTQQTENTLLQKQLDLENQIAVAKAKQETATKKEEEAIKRLIAQTKKSMNINIDNFASRKSKFISSDDEKAIERIRTKLNELNGTSLKDVKNQISNLKLEWKEVSSSISTTELRETSTVVDELGHSIKRLTTYVSGAMVIQQLWGALREGVTYLKELDEAYTDVAISMDISREEFNKWTVDARKIAQANGVMTTSIMDMVKIYATSGETISQIQDKLEGTAMIQNITQWDAEKTTSVVNSIVNQYKLMEKEINGTTGSMSNAIQYMGDALIGVSNALRVDNVTGIQEIASAIDEAGGIMEQSGATMEWYMGVTGTLNEVMNATGSEIGNAMKMISARVFAQAQAMEELGESSENIEVEMRKAEKALASVDVAVRDASDPSKLRGLEEILDELAGKWDTLSDATKNYVAEGVAGTNRRNYFVSMMENYDRVLTLTNEGLNAQGALAEANAVRVESLAGQINIMKDRLLALMDGLTPVIYGGVQLASSILGIANSIGAIPSAIGVATASFLSFNKTGQLVRDGLLQIGQSYIPLIEKSNKYLSSLNAQKSELSGLVEQLKLDISATKANIEAKEKLGQSTGWLNKKLQLQHEKLKGTQVQLAKTTLKTAALQAAMSMGLTLAITVATTVVSKLIGALKDYTDYAGRAQKATENISNLSSDIQSRLSGNIKETISKLDEMIKKYNDANTSQERKVELSSEINALKQELIGYDDEYARILGNENLSYQEQLGLIRQINKEKALENAKALDKELDKQSDLKGTKEWYLNQLNLNDSNIKELEKAIANAVDGMGVFNGQNLSVDKLKEILSAQKEAFQEHYLFLLDWNSNVQTMLDAGWETDKTKANIEEFAQIFEQLATESNEIANANNTIVDTANSASAHLKTLGDTFSALNEGNSTYADSIEAVRAAIQSLGTDTEAQASIVEEFLGVFPEYKGVVENASDVLTLMANEATIELGKAQSQAKEFLTTMSDMNNYTPEFAERLKEAYPELALHIQDTAYVQEFLNDKIAEMDDLYGLVMSQVDVHRTAQEEILANDAEFWNEKMKNSENFLQYQNAIENKLISLGAESLGIQYDDFAQYVESKGGLREVDYNNAHTLAEAENMTEAQKLNSMLKLYGQYVNEKDGYRSSESQLILDFLDWQGGAEATTIEELKQMWAAFYNAKKQALTTEIAKLSRFDETLHAYGEYDTSAYQAQMQLKKLNDMNKALMSGTDLFNSIKTTFKGVGTSYKGGLSSGGLSSSGLNTNPSSGSSSSSSTEKIVEDLDLVIDRYYELNDAIDDVNNALEMNRQLQKMATNVATTKKLHEEEIKLLNEKLEATKKLQLEQRNDMLDHKNLLSTAGFSFDGDGNLTNYSSRLKELQNYANSLSGDAKEAQIAYVNSIVDIIDAYTTLTNDSLPSTELAIEQLIKEIEDVNKEHEKTLKLVEALGDRYYEINGLINDVDKKLALNQAKQENANASERVRLMEEEIALMKEKQDLLRQQSSELQEEAEELAKKLSEKGVEFNADGTVANYKELMDKFKVVANDYVGEYRDEVLDEAEELIDLIKQYDDIIRNTLPDLEVEWEEYTTAIREAEKAMAQQVTDIQKDITSAIQNELQKRTEAVKTELQKQKDAYNKQFDEEDWEDSLTEQQRRLDEIQQAINNMSRDTSLAGKLKLQQLREEYEAQQKVIDDMIRDKEKENGNNRFDEEMEKAEQELEEALDAQNIADLVNKALVDGFVTIGDEIIQLDTLMTDWLNETGDGLYAIGNTLREELIENLRVAQELMAGMGITSVGVSTVDQNTLLKNLEETLNATLTATSGGNTGQKLDISIGSLVEVQGNVTEDVLPKLESMISTAKEELIEEIASELMKR